MIQSILQEPKRLFLADALGALLTAFLNFAVIAQFESVFGLPKYIVYYLGTAALLFAVYSFSCFLILPEQVKRFIFIIASANVLYVIATILLLIRYNASVSLLGWLYFIGEIIVIAGIAATEFKAAKNELIQKYPDGSYFAIVSIVIHLIFRYKLHKKDNFEL